jgi:predicted AlkP superfamily phosphohydrolase/phosphomutase
MEVSNKSEHSEKVVVIGLDAATPKLIETWMAEGRLPNLTRIAERGAYGHLRSTLPPASPLAWNCFLTGVNPGKHGIFGFAQRKPGTYRQVPVNARDCLSTSIAQVISTAGKSVGLLFVPLTFPPEPVNGFVVSGMGTPSLKAPFTYPSDLKGELLDVFRAEQISEPSPAGQTHSDYFASLEQSIRDKARIMHYVLDRYPDLDLFETVFIETDRVQHFGWHYMDESCPGYAADAPIALKTAILRCYQELDRVVGELLERLDADTTLFIVSDHGAGPYRKFVDLNRWLEQEGFLAFNNGGTTHESSPIAKLYSIWRRGPRKFFSPAQRHILRRFLPYQVEENIAAQARNSVLARIDWSRTQAFSEGADGLISLNLKGREPNGIVAKGVESDNLIDEISERLYALRDPSTGERVVARVHRREELYYGPAVDRSPDLVIEWHQEQYHSLAIWTGSKQMFHEPGQWWGTSDLVLSGHHSRDGIVFALGPGVPAGLRLDNSEIVDIPVTILHLLGLPIPGGLDGNVLRELCVGYGPEVEADAESEEVCPIAEDDNPYSEEEEELIEEMLRTLGYLG